MTAHNLNPEVVTSMTIALPPEYCGVLANTKGKPWAPAKVAEYGNAMRLNTFRAPSPISVAIDHANLARLVDGHHRITAACLNAYECQWLVTVYPEWATRGLPRNRPHFKWVDSPTNSMKRANNG